MWNSKNYDQDDAPQVLDSLDLPGIAKYIKSDVCENIFVMAGAGISTSAGIPDFRSPDTGLYANLERLKLPYPEAVFDITFFRRNPRPFYTLAHELAPGKFRPTPTHSFINLLAKKKYLHTCFTQNIDTLERRAGVPTEKIIEAHGSFASQHCIKCGASYPDDKMKEMIEKQEIPICEAKQGCNGYVKPDIVFFGESLPPNFFSSISHLRSADLLIVMGTSLTVHPFASLTEMVDDYCPRLLLNLDRVGGWGSRTNDVVCLMPCDDAVRKLCSLLGWEEELDSLWKETASTVVSLTKTLEADEIQEGKRKEEEAEARKKRKEDTERREYLKDFVGQLAERIRNVEIDVKGESDTETSTNVKEKKEETAKDEVGLSGSVTQDTVPSAGATPVSKSIVTEAAESKDGTSEKEPLAEVPGQSTVDAAEDTEL